MTLAQSGNIAAQRRDWAMRSPRHLFVWDGRFFGRRKIRHQMGEKLCFASERALLREPIQRLPQKQRCPLTVIDFLSLPFCCARNLRLHVCRGFIVQVLENYSAATFQSPSMIAHIRNEMFQCAEQKGTKPSLLPVGAGICTTLDQVSEKALGQIPRVLSVISLFA